LTRGRYRRRKPGNKEGMNIGLNRITGPLKGGGGGRHGMEPLRSSKTKRKRRD